MRQRVHPSHIFENVSSGNEAQLSFHIHDTVRKAFLLVEPLRHVVDCWGEKHPCTYAIKRTKANDQLEWLLKEVSGILCNGLGSRRTVVAKAPPSAERKHNMQPAQSVSFRCTG